jgi:hypothetical protein
MSPGGKRRWKLASQHEIEIFRPEIDDVLAALGHPEALVTDKSRLSDFEDARDAMDLVALRMRVGVPLERDDLLVDIAARMRAKVR